MTYDLTLGLPSAAVRDRVTRWLDAHASITREGDHALYRNEVSFTEFSLWLEKKRLGVEVNYLRPFVFAQEVAAVLESLCASEALPVESDPQIDGIESRAFSVAAFLRGWTAGTLFGYRSLIESRLSGEVEMTYPPIVAYEVLARVAKWNRERTDTGALQLAALEVAPIVLAIVVLDAEVNGKILLPAVDAYMFQRDGELLGGCVRRELSYTLDLDALDREPDDAYWVPAELLHELAASASNLDVTTLYPWDVWETELVAAAFDTIEEEARYDPKLVQRHREAAGLPGRRPLVFADFAALQAHVRRSIEEGEEGDDLEMLEETEDTLILRGGWSEVERTVVVRISQHTVGGMTFVSVEAAIARPEQELDDEEALVCGATGHSVRVVHEADGTVTAERWFPLQGCPPERLSRTLGLFAFVVDEMRVEQLGEEGASEVDDDWTDVPARTDPSRAVRTEPAASFRSPSSLVMAAVRDLFRDEVVTFHPTYVHLRFKCEDTELMTDVSLICLRDEDLLLMTDLAPSWVDLDDAVKGAGDAYGFVGQLSYGTAIYTTCQPICAFDRERLSAYLLRFVSAASNLQSEIAKASKP